MSTLLNPAVRSPIPWVWAGKRVRLLGFAAAVCVVLAGRWPCSAQTTTSDSTRQAVDHAVASVYPALVRIHVVTTYYDDGREKKMEGSGSGVIISPEGHVITNHHVAGKAKRVICTLSNKEQLEARVVGTDALTDIAVLQLDLSERRTAEPLAYATFGDSSAVRVGDRVLAMGCPLSLSQSVTEGIVSNIEMITPSLWWGFDLILDGERVGLLVKWIGHDALIRGGNSGGPLVDLNGRIIGINEVGMGLGGAIPSNLAKSIAEQLIKDGRVRRSWTGLELQPLLKSMPHHQGVLVGGVVKGSPADRAGVEPGDILLKYDGREVLARFDEQLPQINRIILETPVGKTVELAVSRDGQQQVISMTTTLRDKPVGDDVELPEWGITARDLTTMSAKELKRDGTDGVLVMTVRPGGPVAEAKPDIRYEDIIIQTAGRKIRNIAELKDVTDQLTAGRTKRVKTLVVFERKLQNLLTVVRVGIVPPKPKPAEATKAWIAADIQVLTRDLARALKLKGSKGVRITRIHPDRNADQAGLKMGDVLLRFDGELIPAQNPEDIEVLPAMVRQREVGQKVMVDVVRNGEAMQVEIELEPSPKPLRQMEEYKDEYFEFTAREVGFVDSRSEILEDSPGVVVSAVEPGGWAAVGHLAVGDFIKAVNGQGVTDIDQLEQMMKQIAEAKQARVVFFVRRGIHTLFVEVEPAWKPGAQPSGQATSQQAKEQS